MLSESHRQLLITMMDYELRNHIDLVLREFERAAEKDPFSNIRETDKYLQIKRYFEERIKELKHAA